MCTVLGDTVLWKVSKVARKRPRPSATPSRVAITHGRWLDPASPDRFDRVMPWPSSVVRSDLSEIEDHRLWSPDHVSVARSPRRSRHRLVVHQQRGRPGGRAALSNFNPFIAFDAPRYVLVCVRRNIRRAVLHALKKTGRGSSRKRKHRNSWSDVRC